jgi:hypothetical protein
MLKIAAVFMCSILVLLSILMGIPGETFSDISLKLSAETAATEEYVMNKWCEVILTAQTQNASDAFDVIVSATFTGPGGQTYEIPGRHRTGNQWAIRFLPPAIGQWSYETFSRTHPQDAGLHGVKGTVTKSAEPQAPKVFLVKDYVLASADNARTGIRDAINAASAYTRSTGLSAEVRFEPGASYRIEAAGGATTGSTTAITVSNAKNLILNGQGATLVNTNMKTGVLQFSNCENLIVKDLNIDFDPLPYSYGTITYIDGNIYHFKIDEGYIEFDHPGYDRGKEVGTLGVKISYENGVKIYGQPVAGSKTFEPLGNREWRLDSSTVGFGPISNAGLKVYDKFVIGASSYAQALAVSGSKNVVLEKINILASPGLSFFPSLVEEFVMRDCHTKVKGDRPISTNADGIHMRGSRGNVLIEGCTFEGMMDDGINIHSSPFSVTKKIANNQYELSKVMNTIRVGDRLQAVQQGTGIIIDTVTVTDLGTQTWVYSVTFDKDIDLKAGTSFSNADNLYNLDECASAFVIKDCTFNAYRGRGILLSSQNGLVYGNTFNIQGSPCIHFSYETVYWGEGPYGRNIIIRNNTFNRIRSSSPPIVSGVQASGGGAPLSVYENIYILNNTFAGFGISATGVISMSNTVTGTPILEGNLFTMLPTSTETPQPTASPTVSSPASQSSSSSAPQATVTLPPASSANPSEDLSPGASIDPSGEWSDSESSIPESKDLADPDPSDSKDSDSSTEDPDRKGPWGMVILVLEIIVIAALLATGGLFLYRRKK